MYVCTPICVCAYEHASTCEDQRTIAGIIPQVIPILFFNYYCYVCLAWGRVACVTVCMALRLKSGTTCEVSSLILSMDSRDQTPIIRLA